MFRPGSVGPNSFCPQPLTGWIKEIPAAERRLAIVTISPSLPPRTNSTFFISYPFEVLSPASPVRQSILRGSFTSLFLSWRDQPLYLIYIIHVYILIVKYFLEFFLESTEDSPTKPPPYPWCREVAQTIGFLSQN